MKKVFATEIKEGTENPLFAALCVLFDLCAGELQSQISLGKLRKTNHRGHGGSQRNIKSRSFPLCSSVSSVVKFIEILVSDDFAVLLDLCGYSLSVWFCDFAVLLRFSGFSLALLVSLAVENGP